MQNSKPQNKTSSTKLAFILFNRAKKTNKETLSEKTDLDDKREESFRIFICKNKVQRIGLSALTYLSDRLTQPRSEPIADNQTDKQKTQCIDNQNCSVITVSIEKIDLNMLLIPKYLKDALFRVQEQNNMEIWAPSQDDAVYLQSSGFLLRIKPDMSAPIFIRTTERIDEISVFMDDSTQWQILYIKMSKNERIVVGGTNPFIDVAGEAYVLKFKSFDVNFLKSIEEFIRFKWNENDGFYEDKKLYKLNENNRLELVTEDVSTPDSTVQLSKRGIDAIVKSHLPQKIDPIKAIQNNSTEIKSSSYVQKEEIFEGKKITQKQKSQNLNDQLYENKHTSSQTQGKRIKTVIAKPIIIFIKSMDIIVKWNRFGCLKVRADKPMFDWTNKEHRYFWIIDLDSTNKRNFIHRLESDLHAIRIHASENENQRFYFEYDGKSTQSNIYFIETLDEKVNYHGSWKRFLEGPGNSTLNPDQKSQGDRHTLPPCSILFVFAIHSIEKRHFIEGGNLREMQKRFLQIVASETNPAEVEKDIFKNINWI